MSDINDAMCSFVVKQEVIEDEPHTSGKEMYILPDREISDIQVKLELPEEPADLQEIKEEPSHSHTVS